MSISLYRSLNYLGSGTAAATFSSINRTWSVASSIAGPQPVIQLGRKFHF
jgi:hypothetical protein